MKLAVLPVLLAALFAPAVASAGPALVLWAWERPEDLRAAGPGVEVAAMTGFVDLSGDRLRARSRRFPLLTDPAATRIAMVHVQIDPHRPLQWSPALRERTASAVLAYAKAPGVAAVQVDFEVRASQRPVLLDVLRAVRAGLPPGVRLSMTALASWCETETWLADAPVDEVVPMVFRMGPGGAALKAKLAAGGDFAQARCHDAIGVSLDTPLARIPAGRRVYVFNPHSWTPADLAAVVTRHAS